MLKTENDFELALAAEAYPSPDTATELEAGGTLLFAEVRLRQQKMPADAGLKEGCDPLPLAIGLQSKYLCDPDLE